MRLDGFYPTAQPPRAPRPAAVPVEQASAPAPTQSIAVPANTMQRVEPTVASGEYIPARQGTAQPVYGHANQALASYQSIAHLTDADADGIVGIDLFV